MTPLSNRSRLEKTFMMLKTFNYVISEIIVIVKNSLRYTMHGILERKLA